MGLQHSSEENLSPVSSISIALPVPAPTQAAMRGQRAETTAEPGVCGPTSLGSGQEEPPSAMSPRRAKAEAMLTPEAAKRMSQWSAMAKPMPAQAPLIAAITCAAAARGSARGGGAEAQGGRSCARAWRSASGS